jgi:hypothetical protein
MNLSTTPISVRIIYFEKAFAQILNVLTDRILNTRGSKVDEEAVVEECKQSQSCKNDAASGRPKHYCCSTEHESLSARSFQSIQ